MAYVGKRKLPQDIRARIDTQLMRFLKSNQAAQLFTDLFTDTERLMLAKRLAAILMLIEEHSYYRIKQSLGLSVSTSKRLHSLLLGGAFPSLERLIARRRERDQLIEDIGLILRAGLPPYAYVIKKRRER